MMMQIAKIAAITQTKLVEDSTCSLMLFPVLASVLPFVVIVSISGNGIELLETSTTSTEVSSGSCAYINDNEEKIITILIKCIILFTKLLF